VKIYATYLGPEKTKYFYVDSNHKRTFFPYQTPIEVDKETAKFLRTLKKVGTDDPRFRLSTDKKEEPVDES